MKYLIIFVLISMTQLNTSCSNKKSIMSGTVSYISMKNDVLSFRCNGTGSNKEDATKDAQINAFKFYSSEVCLALLILHQ
jgi:hypothetical protein